MTESPIPQHILSWRACMRIAAGVEDLTVTFTGAPEDMTFTVINPDGDRHINLKIADGTVYMLPSPKINLGIHRMVAICKTIIDAHNAWAKENPE